MLRRIFVGLLLLSFLSGCASMVATGVADRGARDDGRTNTERDRDARIVNRINDAYVGERSIRALDVRVSAYRGTVTLSGTLPSPAVRDRAVQIARDTQGVRRVIDRLVVPR